MVFNELIAQKKHIEKYTYFQEQTYKVAELMNNNKMFTDSDRIVMGACGDYLSFGITDNGEVRLIGSNFCRKRYCPMCQWRKSERQFTECLKLSEALSTKGYRFIHMVLTVPNCDGGVNLQNTIKKMNKAFAVFIRYKEVSRAFKGIMRCLEISFNYDTNQFHPHYHCLVAVRSSYFNNPKHYLSYKAVQELWSNANKSEQPLQCSIGAIKGNDNLGFAEVSKYCLKPLDFKQGNDAANAYVLGTLAYTLKGTRFIQTYGVIKDELKKIKNEKATDSVDNIEHTFDYCWNYQDHKYERMNEDKDGLR